MHHICSEEPFLIVHLLLNFLETGSDMKKKNGNRKGKKIGCFVEPSSGVKNLS